MSGAMSTHRRHRRRLRRAHHRRLLRPPRPQGHLRRRRARTRSSGLVAGRRPDPRGRPGRAGAGGARRRAPVVRARRRPPPSADAEFVYLCVPTPQARRRVGRPVLHPGGGGRDRPAAGAGGHRRQQVDRAGRLDPGGRGGPRPRRRAGRVQPRVPARGLGRARLPAPRPHRHRLRRPGRRRPGGRRCSSALRAPVIVTDPASAETIKYASNAFLAAKVVVRQRRRQRVRGGRAPTSATSCSAWATTSASASSSCKPGPGIRRLVLPEGHRGPDPHRRGRRATTSACSAGVDRGQRRAVRAGGGQGRAAWPAARSTAVTVAAWGLTFKARTDDLRDVARPRGHRAGCGPRGARVRAYDPAVDAGGHRRRPARRHRGRAPTPTAACDGAAVLVVLTEWDEFRGSTSPRSPALLRPPLQVVDARNLLDPAALRTLGFRYAGIGR